MSKWEVVERLHCEAARCLPGQQTRKDKLVGPEKSQVNLGKGKAKVSGGEPREEAKPKKDEQPHPFVEVPGRRGQHKVELIASEAFQEAAQEPKIMLEMTEQRFNSRSAAEALSHHRTLGSRLSCGSSSWHQDLSAINRFSAPVAAIHDGGSGTDIGNGLGLVKDFRQSVSIVEVLFSMRHGRHDDSIGLAYGH